MMHPYELHSSNLDLLEVRHQLVSDQHPLARAGSIHHELFSPPDFLSRSFCQAFCLDFKSDPNPKLVAVTKSAISTIPGLCYVADLNTNGTSINGTSDIQCNSYCLCTKDSPALAKHLRIWLHRFDNQKPKTNHDCAIFFYWRMTRMDLN